MIHSGSGRGTTRADDAQGIPTHGHMSPSILVYEDQGRDECCLSTFKRQVLAGQKLLDGQKPLDGQKSLEGPHAHNLKPQLSTLDPEP